MLSCQTIEAIAAIREKVVAANSRCRIYRWGEPPAADEAEDADGWDVASPVRGAPQADDGWGDTPAAEGTHECPRKGHTSSSERVILK